MLNLESNFSKPYSNCERPFVVHRIPNSNLILLIAKSDCAKNTFYEFHDRPEVTKYVPSLFCRKLFSPLHRRHSKSCFSYHSHVSMRGIYLQGSKGVDQGGATQKIRIILILNKKFFFVIVTYFKILHYLLKQIYSQTAQL